MATNKKPSKSKNELLKTFARFSGTGVQMGITIYAGAWCGKWLDAKYPMDKNWFTIGLTLLATAIAMYNLLRQVNRYNNES